MTTAATTRFELSLTSARRTAAGLATTLTVALLMGLGGLADASYDAAVAAAQADSQPVQVVVVSAKRVTA